MTLKIRLGIACMAVLAATAGQVQAGTMTFNTSDSQFDSGINNQGWWSDTRPNNNSNENYFTGSASSSVLRSFFTFDLSSLSGTVTSATLSLRRFDFISDEGSETLGFFDVLTDAATLNNNVGSSAAIFADLGTGVSYGSFTLDVATTPDVLTFNLNANALADIQSAQGGFFSIGGSLLTDDGNDRIFSSSGAFDPHSLTVVTTSAGAVPEPTSLAIFGFGAFGLAGFRRRKQKQNA
ncbi:PEP-CTERM motif protein [Novipirellula artificiosorum]|uniref:PEP-CTERM motif protein n=2 Tax=Novipirellula artificiosorum TaxID=2528016 RepID=A0A5C6DKA1_9BACT|nr:PEP-CTERM motif protein [Novipirellula artificiosorum]